MRLSTGRWVSGDDFFDRESELRILKGRVRDGNHVLLTGQRRMGKTSIARELGRRLEAEGWVFLFTDVEGATGPEDAIADIARAVHPVRAISSRFATRMKRWVTERLEEISALDFRVKIRAGLNAGSWRRHGGELLHACASHDKPVLLVIDELPIFLKRMLRHDDGPRRVDEFLSWLRNELQRFEAGSLVVHDGYLETGKDGFRFPSRLLRDWWAARFRDHHSPLASRRRKDRSSGKAR